MTTSTSTAITLALDLGQRTEWVCGVPDAKVSGVLAPGKPGLDSPAMRDLRLRSFLSYMHAGLPLALVSVEARYSSGVEAALLDGAETVRAWCEENAVEHAVHHS